MSTASRAVNIYVESNPNPNSLKFVANFMLVPEGKSYDFPGVADTENAPLAQLLFTRFPFIERVFYMSNFITVTKNENTSWESVQNDLRVFIKEYLEEEEPLLLNAEEVETESNEIHADDSEIVKKIKGILEEYVKPAVEMDGGAISFESYDDGVVKLHLQGSCSGCPSSMVTLKSGIENLLKRMLPNDIKEVYAEGV
jgi:NFU1 iron-sulfur cluster scaffold homolog, mitochondrial